MAGRKKTYRKSKDKSVVREQDDFSAANSNVCVLCGGETYDLHCKRICKNCGYTQDCSDP